MGLNLQLIDFEAPYVYDEDILYIVMTIKTFPF